MVKLTNLIIDRGHLARSDHRNHDESQGYLGWPIGERGSLWFLLRDMQEQGRKGLRSNNREQNVLPERNHGCFVLQEDVDNGEELSR